MDNSTDNFLRGFIKFAVAALVASAAGFFIYKFVTAKPMAKRRKRPAMTPVVEVTPVKLVNHQTVVKAMGTVIPEKTVKVKSRVRGEIVAIHKDFVEGGIIKKGDTLVRLDEQDYKLNLTQRRSDLAKVKTDLKLEMGKQDIAKREWELLGVDNASELDKELALRKPQLNAIRSSLESAKVAIERAELDLKRTVVKSPFNAVILSADVRVGDQAETQTVLAEITGTDFFRVEVGIPVSKLKWLQIPGAEVEVLAGNGRTFSGKVVKLLSEIEPNGLMARILVDVEDPFGVKSGRKEKLLLGEYVRVEISGSELKNIVKIPRIAYRNRREVWMLTGENKLQVVPVETVWEERDEVFVRLDASKSSRLIVSDLATVIDGMTLKAVGEGEKKAPKPVKAEASNE